MPLFGPPNVLLSAAMPRLTSAAVLPRPLDTSLASIPARARAISRRAPSLSIAMRAAFHAFSRLLVSWHRRSKDAISVPGGKQKGSLRGGSSLSQLSCQGGCCQVAASLPIAAWLWSPRKSGRTTDGHPCSALGNCSCGWGSSVATLVCCACCGWGSSVAACASTLPDAAVEDELSGTVAAAVAGAAGAAVAAAAGASVAAAGAAGASVAAASPLVAFCWGAAWTWQEQLL